MAELLDARPDVVGWRFDVSEGRSLQAGLKDSRLGGPYEPPSVSAGTGGGLYLRWSDGLVSHGDVDVRAVEQFEQRLAAWRLTAFEDPWAPEILEPRPMPEVETRDPAVEALLEGNPEFVFDLLARARQGATAHRVGLVDAGTGASAGERFVFNSRGLRMRSPETSFSFWLSGDDLYWRSFHKRRPIGDDEALFLIEDVGRTVEALKQPDQFSPGPMPVVLPPSVLEEFVRTFLGANLAGSGVVNGQSAFKLEDFTSGRQVARADVDLWVDTTLPLEPAASPCSSEGVPGGRLALVRGGKLVTPMLDLKYAARAGLPPTPVPRGHPGLLLRLGSPLATESQLIGQVERGLLVLSVLGMHTQDPTTGTYSLVAPQSRVIRNGQLGGTAKAVLAGNFFANLQDAATRFASFPLELNPGALLHCTVTAEAQP
ncbi:MAG: hypothetical protein HY690_12590 [Chloroflexi bacterium]|nr:hypothetical protein [Chloroflexota bacterium]